MSHTILFYPIWIKNDRCFLGPSLRGILPGIDNDAPIRDFQHFITKYNKIHVHKVERSTGCQDIVKGCGKHIIQ